MGIGVSLFLIAVGAILDFAVNVSSNSIDLNTVGAILMIVGGAGLLLSLLFWSSWGGHGMRRTVVYDDGDPTRRRVIHEDEIV